MSGESTTRKAKHQLTWGRCRPFHIPEHEALHSLPIVPESTAPRLSILGLSDPKTNCIRR